MVDESRYPTRIPPYGLRMPPELKERVQAAAEANNRSMNAEIVSRLEATFLAETEGQGMTEKEILAASRAFIDDIERRIAALEEHAARAPGDD